MRVCLRSPMAARALHGGVPQAFPARPTHAGGRVLWWARGAGMTRPILGRFLERFVNNLPKGPTGITLLLDTTVYAPKHLDEVGRCECCRRKPLVYKRTRDPRYPRGHFCSSCDRAYSLETGDQIENWAWRAVDDGFQSTAKRPTSNPPLMPGAPKCHYCNDTGMVACRSRDGQYAFAGPVPDDAKGYFDADCWYCDSGRRPEEISPREALR